MVLACCHCSDVFSVAHNDKTSFFALQEFLNNNSCATFVVRHTQNVVIRIGSQHELNRLMSFMQRHCNNHTFASCQTISLDNDRSAFRINIGMRCYSICKGFVIGCWNVVPLHKSFRKCFRAFKLCCRFSRAKYTQSMRTKFINNACG